MPVHKNDVQLTIKTGPQGSILSEGRLKWRDEEIDVSSENESHHETFIIQAEDVCGNKELFSLSVMIQHCRCGDHGECQVVDLVTGHTFDNGIVVCNCHTGYHGT